MDDPEYKPGGHKRPSPSQRPIITAPPAGLYGEVFDVTVHAIQGGKATGKPVIVPGKLKLDVKILPDVNFSKLGRLSSRRTARRLSNHQTRTRTRFRIN